MAKFTCGASLPVLPIRPEHGAGDDLRALAQRPQLHRVAVEVEHAAEVGLEGRVAGELLGQQLVELARDVGAVDVVRALRQGVEPLAQVLGVHGALRWPCSCPRGRATRLPRVAGWVGALSFFGVTSLKSEAESLCCFGTG